LRPYLSVTPHTSFVSHKEEEEEEEEEDDYDYDYCSSSNNDNNKLKKATLGTTRIIREELM